MIVLDLTSLMKLAQTRAPVKGRFCSLTIAGETHHLCFFPEDGQPVGALAPVDHVHPDGTFNFDHSWGLSFAHVFPDGRIMRFKDTIGTFKDLKFVDVIDGEVTKP